MPLLTVMPGAAAGVELEARPIAPSLQAADCRRLHGDGTAAGWLSGTVDGAHSKGYCGLYHCWLAVMPPSYKRYTARPANMAAAKGGLRHLRVGANVLAGRFGAGSLAHKAAAAAPAAAEPPPDPDLEAAGDVQTPPLEAARALRRGHIAAHASVLRYEVGRGRGRGRGRGCAGVCENVGAAESTRADVRVYARASASTSAGDHEPGENRVTA